VKNILIRSGKDPLRMVSPEATLQSNLIGRNSGNLLFSTSAHKLLSTSRTNLTSNSLIPTKRTADEINERFDVFVLPLANAFRHTFLRGLDQYSDLIERLRIPVVVMSVGAQASAASDPSSLSSLDQSVERFMRAVLERSASVAVRGEFTAEYLRRLGFHDVDVVGCPSMFLHGPGPFRLDVPARLGSDASVAVNAAAKVQQMGPILEENSRRYSNLTYVCQDSYDLRLLLWADPAAPPESDSPVPLHAAHPLYASGDMAFFVDPWPWIEFLSDCDFSFGSRIHGNIAALLGGTPAVVLAHDSRTLELARYFDIPYRLLSESSPSVTAEELLLDADFDPFLRGYDERLRRYLDFMERNDLPHCWQEPEVAHEFQDRLEDASYPAPVRPATVATNVELVQRMRWLKEKEASRASSLNKRIASLEARLTELESSAATDKKPETSKWWRGS
jgi:hypothetical protein